MASPRRPETRYLQANAGTECPSQLVFFDTETRWKEATRKQPQERHRFRLGCATYLRLEAGKVTREQSIRFKSTEGFWEWLEGLQKPRQVLWAFAHNIAFDLQILKFWERFQNGEYTCGPLEPGPDEARVRGKRAWRGRMVWGASPCFLFLMGRHGRVNLVDSYNYWRSSLASAADLQAEKKGKLPDQRLSDEEWFGYCEQDVRVLRDLVVGALTHWRQLDGGVWQPTGPALALQSFRHQELNGTDARPAKKILLSTDPETALLERDSYYGGYFGAFYSGPVFEADDPCPFTVQPGTNELIRRPTGPLWEVDCNGLYPFVMKTHSFPFKRAQRRDGLPPKDLARLFPAMSATARVRINTLAAEYPVRHEDHLLYMVGDYWTTLCGVELHRALKAGHVQDVAECATYRVCRLFERWVAFWHGERMAAREKGDANREGLAKLILSSLYGKFAQKGGGWANVFDEWSQGPWQQWMSDTDTGRIDPVTKQPIFEQRHFRDLGGQVQERVVGDDPSHAFPAISAHVAAAAREYMRSVRAILPEKSCFYQGTDSLIVDTRAMERLEEAELLDPLELGHFKFKGPYKDGLIVGANHYRIGDKQVRSGTYGRAEQDIGGAWHARIFEGATSFTSREPDGVVRVTEVELTKHDHYPKGDEQPDGWVQWMVHDKFFQSAFG